MLGVNKKNESYITLYNLKNWCKGENNKKIFNWKNFVDWIKVDKVTYSY